MQYISYILQSGILTFPRTRPRLSVGNKVVNILSTLYKCICTGHTLYKGESNPACAPACYQRCDSFSIARDHAHPVRLPSISDQFSCPVDLLDGLVGLAKVLGELIDFFLKLRYGNGALDLDLGLRVSGYFLTGTVEKCSQAVANFMSSTSDYYLLEISLYAFR